MSVPRGSIAKGGAVALALLLAGCRPSPPRGPVLGEAYIGPASLGLRSDIPTQSSTVVTLKHGDRVEILQQRRSFLRVRAPNGAEGWTDQRQLLAGGEDNPGPANLRLKTEVAEGVHAEEETGLLLIALVGDGGPVPGVGIDGDPGLGSESGRERGDLCARDPDA